MTKPTQPKISIVVPIYNVEKYLRECINSILGQTLKDIEVILVDDGSPDNCGKIVDEYAKKDPRVVPVHQKNSGYSIAVNRGIALARGEYIGIIESDDWIEPNMYEKLYQNAKKFKTDITKGGFFVYNSTLEKAKQNKYFSNPSGIDLRLAPKGAFAATNWPQIIGFHSSIWSSIYKANFVKKIKFPETAGASYQDFPFMIEAMTKARRISVVPDGFIHWRNDPEQNNSTSAHGKKLLLMAKNTETALKIIKDSGHYDALKEAFFVHALWTNIGFFFRIDLQYKEEYYLRLQHIFANLRTDPNFKYRFFRKEDLPIMKALLKHKTWYLFELAHICGGVKRRLKRLLCRN